jgi:hypothetical protein
MPSTTRTRKPKPAPANTCRLTLTINSVPYSVRPVASEIHFAAWSLRKQDGTVYHVARGEYGPECDCADCTFRDRPCKHIRASVAAGLL